MLCTLKYKQAFSNAGLEKLAWRYCWSIKKEIGKETIFLVPEGNTWDHWELAAEQLTCMDTGPCFSAYKHCLEQLHWKLFLLTSKQEAKSPEPRNYAFHLSHVMLPLWWGRSHHHQSRGLTNGRWKEMKNLPILGSLVRPKNASGIECQDTFITTG